MEKHGKISHTHTLKSGYLEVSNSRKGVNNLESTISHEVRLLPQCFSVNDDIIKGSISSTNQKGYSKYMKVLGYLLVGSAGPDELSVFLTLILMADLQTNK